MLAATYLGDPLFNFIQRLEIELINLLELLLLRTRDAQSECV